MLIVPVKDITAMAVSDGGVSYSGGKSCVLDHILLLHICGASGLDFRL